MLESLGLTTYENDTFTTLLKIGEADARQISEQSGVPFGRIYDILSLLESKNLILVQPSRPKKYRPIEPRNAVKMLLDQKKRDLKELEKEAKMIEAQLTKIYQPGNKDSIFWKVGIGENLIPSYIDMMRQTEEELLGYLELHPSVTNENIELFFNVVTELLDRSVRTKFLIGTTAPERIIDILDQYQLITGALNVKMVEPMSEPFNIIDNRKVILKVRNPVKPENDFAFIYVWDESLAQELRNIYNQLWQQGDLIKDLT